MSYPHYSTECGEYHGLVRDFGGERPPIVVLCGSTRFMDAFHEAGWRLTLAGEIVLSVGVAKYVPTPDGGHAAEALGSGVAEALDELHKRKIDLADSVYVVSDPEGYFGQSTASEIAYAVEHGKPVRFDWSEAHRRAWDAGLLPVAMCGCTQVPEAPLCEHQRQAAAREFTGSTP